MNLRTTNPAIIFTLPTFGTDVNLTHALTEAHSLSALVSAVLSVRPHMFHL